MIKSIFVGLIFGFIIGLIASSFFQTMMNVNSYQDVHTIFETSLQTCTNNDGLDYIKFYETGYRVYCKNGLSKRFKPPKKQTSS